MTKPEAKNDVAFDEKSHGYYLGTEKYALYF
jgi:hypothetical protein